MDASERHLYIEAKLRVFREDLTVRPDAPKSIQVAVKRIHDRLFESTLTVERLRRRLGLTSATFSARFRRYHDWTPARYIRRLRVEAAKSLLQHDEIPAADIAFHVGYDHYRTFARIFKRVTSRSPRAFREEVNPS